MRAPDILRKKRDGNPLEAVEIDAFVRGVTDGSWTDYQAAALLMAICCRGMDGTETGWLTHAMANSGARLDFSELPGPKVDKHSTGGVGDKTSLILAPLAAACGAIVPMMSGRGLGHTGGTLDKLEAIPGFRTGLDLVEFRASLRTVGCALVGQTAEIAPADRHLYALRDVTGTVESIPLITASILSKKLAEGLDGLVLDVKCGRGAFMKTREDAEALARSLVAAGTNNKLGTEAILTNMEHPLGLMVGNSLEVVESLEVLQGKGEKDLETLSVLLAARMLLLGKLAGTIEEAEAKIRDALTSGRGLQKFRQIIERQGGDPRVVDEPARLPLAPQQHLLRAERDGYVSHIDAEGVGRGCMRLGAGRDKKEDPVDHSVGLIVRASPGQKVRTGEVLAEIHYRHAHLLGLALPLLAAAWTLADQPPNETPLILGEISA